MPKIVVREFDKTTAVGAPYSNFAVVVPGFVSDKAKDVFDENGIYECKNKEDFRNNVGFIGPRDDQITSLKAPTYGEGWESPRGITESEFDELVKTGTLYFAVNNESGKIGACKDKNYKYDLATVEDKEEYVFINEQSEAVQSEGETDQGGAPATLFVKLDDIGHDATDATHYGNQIAYELLKIGYTVLYKKINELSDLTNENFWKPLKDKTMYDFRYIMSGLISGNKDVYEKMLAVAEFNPENKKFDEVEPLSVGRGDCIALFDVDEDVYKGKDQESAIDAVVAFAEKYIPNSKYAAVFAPSVKYKAGSLSDIGSFDNNQWFPASFHYLACAARSSESFNEWYANAGYARGISNYAIETVGIKFGEAAVNMFQKRAAVKKGDVTELSISINPIINLRGSYYLWGNRTAEELGDPDSEADSDLKASHFLNIRQLCSTIKKQVYVTCRQSTFDPNSDTLWVKFRNSITPMLDKMKADQGIADYKILKVKNSRKAFLSAIIRIVPIEAVEDFDISVYLEDSLNGTIANTEE